MRTVLFWAFVLVWTLTMAAGALAIAAVPRVLLRQKPRCVSAHTAVWARVILGLARVRVQRTGTEHLTGAPCLFAANHSSYLDVWAMVALLGPNCRFGGKRALFRIPILGWAMTAVGHVSLSRGDHARDVRTIERMVARVHRDQISVCWFPEGTRSPDGRLRPFKKGIAHFACQTRLPVTPVAIHGAAALLPKGRFAVRPGTVTLQVLPSVPTDALTPEGRDAFVADLHARLAAALAAPPALP